VSGTSPGQAPDGAATVLVERRRQGNIVLSLLVAAFAVALFRLVTGAQTSTGRVVGSVVFGAILVALIVGWIRMSRSARRRLEITEDAIRYVPPDGCVPALSRQWGDELRFVIQHRAAVSRVWVLGLTIKGTDTVMDLRGEFSREAVRQACLAHGWRFDKQRRNWRRTLKLSRPGLLEWQTAGLRSAI
jgi:hypothetical protein